MYHKSISILFYLNKSKINRKGVCPIKCRITYLKARKEFSTGLFIDPINWNAKKQLALSSDDNSQYLNGQMQIISSKINISHIGLQIIDKDFNVEHIFQNYIGETPISHEVNLISHFHIYLEKKKNLIGIDIQMPTWRKFVYVCQQTQRFIKWKYGKNDIPLRKLRLQFLHDFEYYLKTERKQKQITVNKAIQRLRKPIKEALAEGSLDRDPFTSFRPKSVPKEIVFLTSGELKRLENYQFIQPRLQLVQDLFVFCCYTGLAYHEMSNLKKVHIVQGFDGNQWIRMKRKKTNKMISVPLLPKATAILEKYNEVGEYALPKFSNQKINSYLKEIGAIVGIDKPISHHMARKTFASTVLLYNDVPMEIVSELLGHSSIKITQDYYGKVVQKKVSEEMDRISRKLE